MGERAHFFFLLAAPGAAAPDLPPLPPWPPLAAALAAAALAFLNTFHLHQAAWHAAVFVLDVSARAAVLKALCIALERPAWRTLLKADSDQIS